ncbi:MAG: DUF3224 domain-containing protein [Actinomycetota bacterium]
MGDSLNATFEVASWDETTVDEGADLGKITRASVTRRYQGGVNGESVTEWLMAYRLDGTATFVGIERVRGSVGGRDGTLVLQHVGEYTDGVARAALTVLPDSGTGALAGVTGEGRFTADPKGSVTLDLGFA